MTIDDHDESESHRSDLRSWFGSANKPSNAVNSLLLRDDALEITIGISESTNHLMYCILPTE